MEKLSLASNQMQEKRNGAFVKVTLLVPCSIIFSVAMAVGLGDKKDERSINIMNGNVIF